MKQNRKIELLAPAKNLACGIEAINHGADAVYIGAPQFSARAAAGNTIEDIKSLASYAHLFGAKVYVALNTLLTDSQLADTEALIWQLYTEVKVDALIIQDMGITLLNLPPIALHASTQMDNRTVEKVQFLEKAGFRQIVLARELTLSQITNIAAEVNIPLEAFVHGSLCVCYSGQCYLSEALSGRSANKGTCAQYCRLPYDLLDATGEKILAKKHLLSMKDLNLSDSLEEMLDAGISSFKIEGRLKDISYVKNVVAYYRQGLDKILARRPQYTKASAGRCNYSFEPNLAKSFNRGHTSYFLHNRAVDMCSIDSPKSLGEPMGKVIEVNARYLRIASNKEIHNGDGLCFFNEAKELEGLQVNSVDNGKIYALQLPTITVGTLIYRNHDHEWEKVLSKKSGERKIKADIIFSESPTGFVLEVKDENNNSASISTNYPKDLAQKDQRDALCNNLRKAGNTIFAIDTVTIEWTADWFIQASAISDWRRLLLDKLLLVRTNSYTQEIVPHVHTTHAFPVPEISYIGNVLNDKSKQFYTQHQSLIKQPAFEQKKQAGVALMFTRYCIKQALGWCPNEQTSKHPYQEPFYLRTNNTKLRLAFDCKLCEMKVYNEGDKK